MVLQNVFSVLIIWGRVFEIIKCKLFEGPIRIPIEMDTEFQRAFSASFGTLPSRLGESDRRF